MARWLLSIIHGEAGVLYIEHGVRGVGSEGVHGGVDVFLTFVRAIHTHIDTEK